MINHLLACLRNVDGAGPPGKPGGLYYPPEFRAARLPGPLAAAHAALFGRAPDAAMLDLRMAQYLRVLHATELGSYLTEPDPRLSYDPEDLPPFVYEPRVELRPASVVVHLSGLMPEEAGTGRLTWRWRLRRDGSNLDTERLTPDPIQLVSLPLVFTAGLSAVVELPGSRIGVRLAEDAPEDVDWSMEVDVLPTDDPGGVLRRLDALGEVTAHALFGAGPGEPQASWRNHWAPRRPFAYRLGAALLAFATRVDALRPGGANGR